MKKMKKVILSSFLIAALLSLGACTSKKDDKTKDSTNESSIVKKKKNKTKETSETTDTIPPGDKDIPYINEEDSDHKHENDDHHGFTEDNFPDPSTLENPDGEPADYKEPTHENYKGGRSPEDSKKYEKEDKEKLENMQEWIDEQ